MAPVLPLYVVSKSVLYTNCALAFPATNNKLPVAHANIFSNRLLMFMILFLEEVAKTELNAARPIQQAI